MSDSEAGPSLKSNRKECYAAKDLYLECMDQNNNEEKKCRALLVEFKSKCPASWVPHFIRKHQFAKYKADMAEKGFTAADQKYEEGAKR